MRIKSWTGTERDGVLLCWRGQRMRIAVPGCEDVVELSWQGGQWFAENRDPVQIDMSAPAEPWGFGPWFDGPWFDGLTDASRLHASQAVN